MTSDPVARYLAAGRLTSDPGPLDSVLAHVYKAYFDGILSRLRIADHLACPRLFVTYTANAVVEAVAIGDELVVVYDQYVGQAFNRLTDFALAAWPPDLVVQWGMKHLAIALATRGRNWEAIAALALGAGTSASERPVERTKAVLDERSTRVAIQEHFILSHECAHAVERMGVLDEALAEVRELVLEAIKEA
jgi:hypothetical protein